MKNLFYLTPVFAVSMLLAACGGPDWVKPDATDAQYHEARAECQVMAEQADEGDVFEDCMKGKGWIED